MSISYQSLPEAGGLLDGSKLRKIISCVKSFSFSLTIFFRSLCLSLLLRLGQLLDHLTIL